MKIAVFTDTHLGFGKGTERFEESFENTKNALSLALSQKPDLIIHAGDFFDTQIPDQETWEKTFKILSEIKNSQGTFILKRTKNSETKEITLNHIPLIAIHGTHEYRSKDFCNALDVLESAGFIIHLHAEYIVLEKNSEKVAIHGLGGVPEKMALNALKIWNPQPVKDAKNILMLHQSIKEFLPFEDEMIATIGIENLPKNFDLIINGHLHWTSEISEHGIEFLMPGSTITTQMKNLESEKPKGIYVIDTQMMSKEFMSLPNQRKLYYYSEKLDNATPEQANEIFETKISEFLSNNDSMKPLIRVKIKGKLAKGYAPSDIKITEIKEKFKDKAILSISTDFSTMSFKKSMAELRELQKSKKSISVLGLELLGKNLSQTDFGNELDYERIFELLEAGENEKVIEMFSKTKK
ncbi:MAG: DNA repair exonuclease [Candidatus Diapherotrites archaeon]